VIGIQWQPSDQAGLPDDVWFYQAIDREVLQDLVVNDVMPHTAPFYDDQTLLSTAESIDSLLPDGSYFGIGVSPQSALRTLNPRKLTNEDLLL